MCEDAAAAPAALRGLLEDLLHLLRGIGAALAALLEELAEGDFEELLALLDRLREGRARIEDFVSIPAWLLVCLLVLQAGLFSEGVMADDLQGIHVTGRAEIAVEPDMARMTLQVSAQADDAVSVKRQIDGVTRSVLKVADRYDIARRDVTAAVVNMSPNYHYENNRRTVEGMQGSRTISVTLRKLDNYGDFMNAVLESGINNISGVTLDTSKRAELEDQALDLAIADARKRAADVAKEFGVALGQVLNVHVQAGHVEPRMMAMSRSADASGGDFSGGELDIRRDIQATFSIKTAVKTSRN